jgi:hypothetical protein
VRLVLVAALAACASKAAAPKPISNEAESVSVSLMADGDYLCWGGFHEYLCTVTTIGGEQRLAKIGGTDQYVGVITPDAGGGFRLVGTKGDGTAMDLTYEKQADGSWWAAIPPSMNGYADHYTLRYMGPAGSVFGSQTYGGGYDEGGG